MKGKHGRTDEIEALERLLDVYGSDQLRWPAGAADRFRRLLAEVPEAQALLAEARALDRILDQAPRPGRERMQLLAERIVPAVEAGKEPGASGSTGMDGRVIQLPARIRGIKRAAAATDRSIWQTAALLAACLVAGVYLGASPVVKPVLQQFADSFGVTTELDSASYAFFDESLEEDAL
jgi:hypothetical protein